MRIHVHWTPRRPGLPDEQEVELSDHEHPRVRDLLDEIQEPYEGVLAVRSGEPIPLDTHLIDGERLHLVRTISGG